MAGEAKKDSAKKKSYSTLEDHQFGWFHMFCQWLSVRLTWLMFHTKYHLHILGKENQPKGFQRYVAVCNHMSNLDPPLMSTVLDFQPIAYMAKKELFEPFWMRTYCLSVSAFSVNREKLEVSTVKTALKVLKQKKWVLGIFPEGTRNKDGTPAEAKRGAAYFAKAGNAPVLPIGVYRNGNQMVASIGPMIQPDAELDVLSVQIQQAIQDQIEVSRRHFEASATHPHTK